MIQNHLYKRMKGTTRGTSDFITSKNWLHEAKDSDPFIHPSGLQPFDYALCTKMPNAYKTLCETKPQKERTLV